MAKKVARIVMRSGHDGKSRLQASGWRWVACWGSIDDRSAGRSRWGCGAAALPQQVACPELRDVQAACVMQFIVFVSLTYTLSCIASFRISELRGVQAGLVPAPGGSSRLVHVCYRWCPRTLPQQHLDAQEHKQDQTTLA